MQIFVNKCKISLHVGLDTNLLFRTSGEDGDQVAGVSKSAPQVLLKFHVRLNYAALKVMPNKTKKGKKQNECGKQAGGHSIQYYLRSDSSCTRNSLSNMTETGDKTSTPSEHGHLASQDDPKIQFGEVISNFQSSINKVISQFKSMMIEEMDRIKDELQSNIVKLADLKESLEFSQTQIEKQKQKMIELQSEKNKVGERSSGPQVSRFTEM